MNKNITAIVFARNEARRIPSIYQNLKDFCEVIVFDAGSTDGTEEYCKKNGIKFVARPEDKTVMRLNTLAWVYENTPTEYVIQVYGAHAYPKQLLEKFSEVANENKKSAVFHDVVIYRYGDVVHRTLFRRISSACVFYKKSIINFEKSKIHDELAISFDEKTMIRLPGRDELSLHLFQDEDCESFTKKTINYEAIEARQRFAAGERMSGIGLALGPLSRFLYRYLRTGSFAKGSKGLVYSILNLIYDFNVSIILWELTNQLTFDDAIRKNAEKKEQLLKNGV
ncbi:glycosyltransferase [Thiobacillus sp.]|uniref:glycosyltransferase n=1 Tax=Thiobacillus sp. TaxID=924 RepID=UPI0025D2362B|nr:glycosyltransferase [Thiobacillus sp.]MBT9540093.1 glycosyltransferase [Thiobacillus sp.]